MNDPPLILNVAVSAMRVPLLLPAPVLSITNVPPLRMKFADASAPLEPLYPEIVPAPTDYKVVEAGYPLTIFARDTSGRTRIAVLELDGGQLKLRSVGELGFTPDMVRRIQAFLDASLPQFGKTASVK